MTIDFTGATDDVKPKPLTRSQHPDLRLFTQIPGKLAWVSNRSYKTMKGADNFLNGTVTCWKNGVRREVGYKVVVDRFGEYRVLAQPIKMK